MLGDRCLRCGLERPLEVAHIIEWPRCFAIAGEEIDGQKPPREWHYGEAVRHFHHLGNMLPLCSNCHTLFDGKQYPEVTEEQIRALRDAVVKKPETLLRLIEFIGEELSGRPGRCTHNVDGKRKHSHAVDVTACTWPLIWLSESYKLGTITDNPNLLIEPSGGGYHYHASLDTGTISLCSARVSDCRPGARILHRNRRARG
ncbi:HNH endonuclease signature motif containing protein [Streptacidiphilus sp. N1-10]|uniref:HNH endonuclease signature motif containing protein n=1 Tax=Streptacidiphilus jeojiensis TaxID=3229225 RepID=A0ABV6XJN9_9ACTN